MFRIEYLNAFVPLKNLPVMIVELEVKVSWILYTRCLIQLDWSRIFSEIMIRNIIIFMFKESVFITVLDYHHRSLRRMINKNINIKIYKNQQ